MSVFKNEVSPRVLWRMTICQEMYWIIWMWNYCHIYLGIQVCSCMHRTYDRVFGIYKIQRTIDCWTSRVYWGQYSFKIFLQFKKRYKCKTRIHNERSKNNPQCNDLYFTLLVKKYFVVLMLFTWKLRSFTIAPLSQVVYLNRRCVQDYI